MDESIFSLFSLYLSARSSIEMHYVPFRQFGEARCERNWFGRKFSESSSSKFQGSYKL